MAINFLPQLAIISSSWSPLTPGRHLRFVCKHFLGSVRTQYTNMHVCVCVCGGASDPTRTRREHTNQRPSTYYNNTSSDKQANEQQQASNNQSEHQLYVCMCVFSTDARLPRPLPACMCVWCHRWMTHWRHVSSMANRDPDLTRSCLTLRGRWIICPLWKAAAGNLDIFRIVTKFMGETGRMKFYLMKITEM